MKKIFFIILAFTSILSASEFEDAEILFKQGKFKECDEKINKAFEIRLSAPQRQRLQAMREYIWGNNPDKIAENVSNAQKIAAHHGWLTNDLVNHSSLLIRRAEDWKSRGIPEYQELSNAAAKLLMQLKDSGNPEIAIKKIILQTKNFNLNGEYNEPIKLIRDALRLYYPVRLDHRQRKSSGEVELLIILGEQYAGLGAATRNEQEKVNALTLCAKYYLEGIKHLSTNSARVQVLSDRLCFCRETLRLLGYNLRLPAKIKPKKSVAVIMIDEMLRMRRFQDVVIALESKKEPVLRLRYAVALSAIGQSDEAVSIVKELDEIKDPHWLLHAARYSLAAGKKENASFFFQCFLKTASESMDTPSAIQQYITILIEQKKYADAAAAYLQLASWTKDPVQQSEILFQGAQCFYHAEKYNECIALFSKISPTPERLLLQAQAKIQIEEKQDALILLQNLLTDKSLSEELRYNAMQLGISCALKIKPAVAEHLLKEILQHYPNTQEMPRYARLLLRLYQNRKAPPNDFCELAALFLKNKPNHPDAIAFVLTCAENISNPLEKEKVQQQLLARKDYSAVELNAVLKYIPSLALRQKFFNRYRKTFQNTPELCELYFFMAETELALKNNKIAIAYVNQLLAQPEVFRYADCMSIRIEANAGLGYEENVRKDCQKLLLTNLPSTEKRRIILRSAQSWERSGNSKKAIAVAWTAIPLTKSTEPYVQELLALIIRNAKNIGSQTDLQDAQELQKE